MCQTGSPTHEPVDAVLDRMNDPHVASSMLALLDDADSITATMTAVRSILERDDALAAALADELRTARGESTPAAV